MILFLDGAHADNGHGKRFHRVKAPTHEELNTLVYTLGHRIGCLGKQEVQERDAENSWLTLQAMLGREDNIGSTSRVATHTGFSLRADVAAEAYQRDKLERLCR